LSLAIDAEADYACAVSVAFWFLFATALARIAGVASALLALFWIGEVFDKARYLDAGFTPARMIEYIALKTPVMLASFMPTIVLLGVAIALVELAMHREIVALRAAGFGLRRLLAPLLAAGAVAGAIAFAIGEWGLAAAKRADAIERVWIKHLKPANGKVRWIRDGHRFFRVEPLGGGRFRLMVLEVDSSGRWLRRIDAASASYRGGIWQMRDVVLYEPQADGVRTIERDRFELAAASGPSAASPPPARFMRLAQLARYTKAIAAAGMDDAPYRYAWHHRFALGASCIVAALLAAAFCLHLQPRAARAGLAAGVVVACGVAWFVGEQTAAMLAASGRLPAGFAAWLGVISMGGFALGRLLAQEGY